MINPFRDNSLLNSNLEFGICQQIHFAALRVATTGLYPEAVPNHIPVGELVKQSHLVGTDIYLWHPAYIEEVFTGVTLDLYRAIKNLYCSRLGRSIGIIHCILTKMADEVNAPYIAYEAVWSICLHLEERRQESVALSTERSNKTWQLVVIEPNVQVMEETGEVYQPCIACILEVETPKVLVFRVSSKKYIAETINLVIFDAIAAIRKPESLAAAGLVWELPRVLLTEIEVSPKTTTILQEYFGIEASSSNNQLALTAALCGNWERKLTDRILYPDEFEGIFDTYLYRIHGYGPRRVKERLEHQFSSLTGYTTDPASLSLGLRLLLPERPGIITSDGYIAFDEFHYENELLKYWPGQQITLRRSEEAESTVWVYLEGEVLCEAHAQELRRLDGSYRKNRIRNEKF